MLSTVTASFSEGSSDSTAQIDVPNSGSENPTNSRDFRILNFFVKRSAHLSICTLILMIVLLLVTVILLLNRDQAPITVKIISDFGNTSGRNSDVKETSLKSISEGPNSNLSLVPKFRIVSRDEWSAEAPIQPGIPLQTPVPYVLILHTGTENCYQPKQCVLQVRFIQVFQSENFNWNDIGYNFMSGGDGEAYEGRGWKAEGPRAFEYIDKSIAIGFIGTFNTSKPSFRQMTACKNLIKKGVELGYIRKDYKLLTARHLQKVRVVDNQEETLYEEVKKWERWTSQDEI